MQVGPVPAASTGLALRDRLAQVLATRPTPAQEQRTEADAQHREEQLRTGERRSQEIAQAGYGASVDLYM